MANATKKPWSYSTGEWGVNRVRAFERQGKGIFLEFRERNPDGTAGRKARIALGHSDRKAAKAKAEEVAAAFRREEPAQGSEATLQVLFDTYGSEVTPEKGESKRKHDVRCAEMFLRYFGVQTLPRTLTRREWDRFVADRRRGAIAPAGVVQKRRVGERVITYDLKWLLSVFNWATTVGDGRGGFLLDRNPFKGLPLPRVESPQRSVLTHEQYLALRGIAAQVAPQFDLALVLAHETGHRIGAIRQLRWSDIDLDGGTVHWRGELDEIGIGAHHAPDRGSRRRAAGRAGDAAGDRGRLAVPGAGVSGPAGVAAPGPRLVGAGREARRFAEGQAAGLALAPPAVGDGDEGDAAEGRVLHGGLEESMTVLTCYQQPDTETQREALAKRKRYRAGAGG
jgi:integrase